jgi:transcription elongation factor/antiterminator RfaH
LTGNKPIDGSARDQLSASPRQEPGTKWPDSCGSRGAAWYCAETHYGQDDAAIAELGQQRFETFLPMVWERRTKGERIRRVEVSMFPGYLFVRFDPSIDPWRRITNTRGVRSILGTTPERPTPLPTDVIQAIADNATALNARFEAMARARLTGIPLRVTKGPWAGMEGVCLWHANDRVRLLLSLFGRPTKIEMPVGRVERA